MTYLTIFMPVVAHIIISFVRFHTKFNVLGGHGMLLAPMDTCVGAEIYEMVKKER